MHAEGASQAAFALQEFGIYDEEAWKIIKGAIADKNFNIKVVKNDRWSLNWKTLTGSEHYYQSTVNSFANELFFEDGLNLYEMYNALVAADKAAPQLGLSDSVNHVQERY